MVSFLNNNILGGISLLIFGAAYLYVGSNYDLGSLRNMGAGYYPLLIGCLIVLIGFVITLQGLIHGGRTVRVAWRPAIAISASIAAFGVAIPLFGLAPAILAAVLTSTTAERFPNPLRTILLSSFLVGVAYVVFVLTLGMPLPLVRLP